jgi:hypothetical protein
MSVPPQLFTLNSLWKLCQTGIPAFFDPPYTLTPGLNGLVQVTMTLPGDPLPTLQSSTIAIAQPASTLSAISTPTGLPPIPPPIPIQSSKTVQVPPPVILSSTGAPTPVISLDPGGLPKPTILTIGSHTIAAGASSITISGTTFSLAPSGTALIINGQTHLLPSPTPSWIISSQVLTPGSTLIVGGTTYSLPVVGNSLFIDGNPSALPFLTLPFDYVVDSQTVSQGGPAVTISGTEYSIPTRGSSIFVNGRPSALPEPVPEFIIGSESLISGSSATTVLGITYSALDSLIYLVGSQTLIAGGKPITVSGTVISLLPGGGSIVVAGTTEGISSFIAATTTTGVTVDETKAPTLNLGGHITRTSGGVAATGEPATSTGSGVDGTAKWTKTFRLILALWNGILCMALL